MKNKTEKIINTFFMLFVMMISVFSFVLADENNLNFSITNDLDSTMDEQDILEEEISNITEIEIDGETIELTDSSNSENEIEIKTPDGTIIPGRYMSACVFGLRKISSETNIRTATEKCKIALQKAVEKKRETIRKRFQERKENLLERKLSNSTRTNLTRESIKNKLDNLRDNETEKIRDRLKDKINGNEKLKERLHNINKTGIIKLNNLNPALKNKIADFDKGVLDKIMKLNRARLNEFMNLSSEQMKEKAKDLVIKKIKIDDFLNKRKIAVEKLEDARNKFINAEEKYNKLKDEYQDKKQAFENLAREIKMCNLVNKNSTKCLELETRANEHAVKYLNHTLELIIKSLEKVKFKLEENSNIDESIVTEKITEINSIIEEANLIMDKLIDVNTKEEIKEIAKKVSELWKKSKFDLNENSVRLYSSNIESVIKRSEVLEQRLDSILSALTENGTDLTEVNSLVDSFSLKINDAKEKYQKSEELRKTIKDMAESEDKIATLKESQVYLKESKVLLDEAFRTLQKIMKLIKQQGGNIEVVVSDTIEIVEE